MTQTKCVELVPSMLLGSEWDDICFEKSNKYTSILDKFLSYYKVKSIQSLTYGLDINLAVNIAESAELKKRIKALGYLSKITGCSANQMRRKNKCFCSIVSHKEMGNTACSRYRGKHCQRR